MEYNEWEMMFPLLILIICESLYIVFFSNLENVHRMECIVSENFFMTMTLEHTKAMCDNSFLSALINIDSFV